MPENTNNERGGPLRRTAAIIVLLALPILALTAGGNVELIGQANVSLFG